MGQGGRLGPGPGPGSESRVQGPGPGPNSESRGSRVKDRCRCRCERREVRVGGHCKRYTARRRTMMPLHIQTSCIQTSCILTGGLAHNLRIRNQRERGESGGGYEANPTWRDRHEIAFDLKVWTVLIRDSSTVLLRGDAWQGREERERARVRERESERVRERE